MSKDTSLAEKLSAPPLFSGQDFISTAPIRLRPVDLAKLLGVSRARISQLTTAGRIKPFPDGSFDPSAVARELIRTENPRVARSKILFQLREEIHDARRLATEAQQARDAALRLHAGLLEAFRELVEQWLRCELWLNDFFMRLEASCADGPIDADGLERAWDSAAAAAFAADSATLVQGPDPSDLWSVLQFDPESPYASALAAHQASATAPASASAPPPSDTLSDDELAELLAMDPLSDLAEEL